MDKDGGTISYSKRDDGSLDIWLERGSRDRGFKYPFTGIAIARLKPDAYDDIDAAMKIIDNLTRGE